VLLPDEQAQVLMDVSERLAPGGTAYFAVRRDVGRGGFRTHKLHGVQTYQANVVLPYASILHNDFCEVYAYRPLETLAGTPGCPFCRPIPRRTFLTESADAYAILDGYPVSKGHALVIPKRHTPSFFDLMADEQAACILVAARVRMLLTKRYAPDGFNVGLNDGAAAGQSVHHAHLHVLPRYTGDVPNPRGGVRNVIPGKGSYRAQ